MTLAASDAAALPGFAGLRGRHFFTDQDYAREELLGLVDLASPLKLSTAAPVHVASEGRTLAMIFEHPSTRTRISFEAAMTELGGHAQYLRPGEIHFGGHETVADTARVVSRLVDAIMARTAFHATLARSWSRTRPCRSSTASPTTTTTRCRCSPTR